MSSRIVVDTNVLVSGLLRPDGPPGRIVDLVVRGSFVVCCDDRILDEYARVLARPRFGFDARPVAVLLDFLEESGERIVAAPLSLRCTDEADQPFLEVAVEARADALVTGNRRHFPKKAPLRIVSPADLLKI